MGEKRSSRRKISLSAILPTTNPKRPRSGMRQTMFVERNLVQLGVPAQTFSAITDEAHTQITGLQDTINIHAQSFVINYNRRFAMLQDGDMYLGDVQCGRD